ncbi:MAG: undecaprenyl-diphosphatase UppP, partial [Minisyncoccia bacterium]
MSIGCGAFIESPRKGCATIGAMDLFLQSVVLGIIEGATEFLPVSSTGHLILVEGLLGVIGSDFIKTFTIVIQLGAILAVVVIYWLKFFDWPLLKKLAAAFIPTGIIGLALYPLEHSFLLSSSLTVLLALFLGGVVLILFERWHTREHAALEVAGKGIEEMTYRDAALVGLAQSVAIIPGVSRSGATIVGGLALGFSRSAIVEFSFLLAVPTMIAASGLSLLKAGFAFSAGEWTALAIGTLVAFLVALAAIRWLLSFVRTHDFTPFGWYRIVLAAAFALW